MLFRSIPHIDKNKHQVTTTIAGSIAMLLVSYLFLNQYGVYAVAVGQMISAIVMLFSRYFISKRLVEYNINWFPIMGLTIGYIIVSIISIYSNWIINIFVTIICIIIAIYVNREFLKEIFKRRQTDDTKNKDGIE